MATSLSDPAGPPGDEASVAAAIGAAVVLAGMEPEQEGTAAAVSEPAGRWRWSGATWADPWS